MPDQDNIVNVQALKKIRKRKRDPSDRKVVRGRPDPNHRVPYGSLYFERSGRRRRNFRAEICDITLYRKGHLTHLGKSVELGKVLPKGRQIWVSGQNNEALGDEDFPLDDCWGCYSTSISLRSPLLDCIGFPEC
jgi:hypothetical protein